MVCFESSGFLMLFTLLLLIRRLLTFWAYFTKQNTFIHRKLHIHYLKYLIDWKSWKCLQKSRKLFTHKSSLWEYKGTTKKLQAGCVCVFLEINLAGIFITCRGSKPDIAFHIFNANSSTPDMCLNIHDTILNWTNTLSCICFSFH